MRLSRGIPVMITTTVYYTILLFGFFLALGMAGVDFNRFTLLAGAFGVGIGFGLQNIVNNFLSGLFFSKSGRFNPAIPSKSAVFPESSNI